MTALCWVLLPFALFGLAALVGLAWLSEDVERVKKEY